MQKTFTVLFRDGGKAVVIADIVDGTPEGAISLYLDGNAPRTRVASFPQDAVLGVIETKRLHEHTPAEKEATD